MFFSFVGVYILVGGLSFGVFSMFFLFVLMAGGSTDVNLKENIILELNRHIKLLEEKHDNLQQTLQLKYEIEKETNQTIKLLEEKIE